MRNHLLIVLVAILGAVLGLVAGDRFGQPPERALPTNVAVLKPGDMRADLELPDSVGAAHRLSEWDGKLVLINFWATWCGPCREEMPLLNQTQAQFSANGFQVIGIAIDNVGPVRDFLKDSPVRYPILIGGDDDTNPALLFGDTRGVLPYSVLIGRDGKIVAQRAGTFSSTSLTSWLESHSQPVHSG